MLPIVVALMIAVCVAGNIRRDAEQLCPSSGIIAPLPAQVDSPANFTVCDGSVNPVSEFHFDWTFDDGAVANISGDPSVQHVFKSTGIFEAQVDAEFLDEDIPLEAKVAVVDCGSVSNKPTIVLEDPEPNVDESVDMWICLPEYDPAYVYLWNFGDGSDTVAPEPEIGMLVSHKYKNAGTYKVTVNVIGLDSFDLRIDVGTVVIPITFSTHRSSGSSSSSSHSSSTHHSSSSSSSTSSSSGSSHHSMDHTSFAFIAIVVLALLGIAIVLALVIVCLVYMKRRRPLKKQGYVGVRSENIELAMKEAVPPGDSRTEGLLTSAPAEEGDDNV